MIQSVQSMYALKINTAGVTSQGHKFICSVHKEKVAYFGAEAGHFYCSKCLFEFKINKDNAVECTDQELKDHAEKYSTDLKALK